MQHDHGEPDHREPDHCEPDHCEHAKPTASTHATSTGVTSAGAADTGTAFHSGPLRTSFFAGLILIIWSLCVLWAIDHTLPSSRSRSDPVFERQGKTRGLAATQERSEKQPKERSEKQRKEQKGSSNKSSEKKPSPKSSRKDRPTDQESSGKQTYSFVGSVSKSVPEVQARKNSAGVAEGSSSENSSGESSGKGDSRSRKEGRVPELTIQVTEENIEAVAARFDYQMAAMTTSGDAILGKVENGTLRSIGKEELRRYAGRARSARKHPDYKELRRQVARQVSERKVDSISLIYLVPRQVERQFTSAQMQALQRRGISPGNVVKMEARPRGRSIEIVSIKRK